MSMSIKRLFGRLLVAGALAVCAHTPSFANGGGGHGGSEGYFPGITNFGGGSGFPGNSDGFQAREPDPARPRDRSCHTRVANPQPLYCR